MRHRVLFVAGLVAVLAAAAVASSPLEDAGVNAAEREYFEEWEAGGESAAAMNAALSSLPGEECRYVTRQLAEAYGDLRNSVLWGVREDPFVPFDFSYGGGVDAEKTRQRARSLVERRALAKERLALATERRDRWKWRHWNVCSAEHIREGR